MTLLFQYENGFLLTLAKMKVIEFLFILYSDLPDIDEFINCYVEKYV